MPSGFSFWKSQSGQCICSVQSATLNFILWVVTNTLSRIYTATVFLSGLAPICRSIKESPSRILRVKCPPNPTEAERPPSPLSLPSPLRPTHHRWRPHPLRQNPAGSGYPIPPRAHIDVRSWKSWTACEPLGRLSHVSRRCDTFSSPCRVGADMDLPMIAVIGSQSAGKSSLIESISGITLPRAAGTCTR